MKKIIMIFCLSNLLLINTCYADWFSAILLLLEQANQMTSGILDAQSASLDVQRDILSTQNQIKDLTKQVNDDMRGHSGWGNYQFHDYQSYGSSGENWNHLLQASVDGQGAGELGKTIKTIANQFPIDQSQYNRGVHDAQAQSYYTLQSETVLATRAASQLDYNQIQNQIDYQHNLQQQIEKTRDIKSALDLNNRLQVEGNLIHLAELRQLALSNQQQAVSAQANVNTALANAKFLTKP